MKRILLIAAAGLLSSVAHAEYNQPHPVEPTTRLYTVLMETCHTFGDGGPIVCFDDAGRKVLLNYTNGPGPDDFKPGNNTRNGYDNRK